MRRHAQVRRYLTAFDTARLPQVFTDVVVIGSGVAALRAALEMAPALQVTLVTKSRLTESNSNYAQGGIAAAVAPPDTVESHVADTLATGCGLSDEAVVRQVVTAAPDCIRELVEWGAVFDRAGDAHCRRTRGRPLGGPHHPRPRRRDRQGNHHRAPRRVAEQRRHRRPRRDVRHRPPDGRRPGRRRPGVAPGARRLRHPGRGGRSWPPAASAASTARPPTPRSPPATAWPWPTGRGRPWPTWSSSSSIPRRFTSPGPAAT